MKLVLTLLCLDCLFLAALGLLVVVSEAAGAVAGMVGWVQVILGVW
jgi:hypothetical protein